MENRVLLLGGCHHIGQHLLVPEIVGEDDCVVDGTQIVGRMGKKMMLWFLQNNKEKIDSDSVVRKAYAYKEQKEKLLAWPSQLEGCTNLAQGCETYQGMHHKLRNYLLENSKPDLVLITDIGKQHRGVVINSDKVKYVVSQDIALLGRQKSSLTEDVYRKAVEKIKQQEKLGSEYQKRKAKRSYQMLVRVLKHHAIPYRLLLMQDYNRYIADDYIDLNPYYKQYIDKNGDQVISKKLQAQSDIALYVKRQIDSA